VNSRLCCLIHTKGCCRLPNDCQLHYHAGNRVLTYGWTIISQHIWNITILMHAIFGIQITIENSSTGKHSIYIHKLGYHTFRYGALLFISCRRWHSGTRLRLSWWRCTCAFAPPACLWSCCCAIFTTMAAIHVIFANHCRVAFDHSLHLVIPGNLKTLLLLFLDCSVTFIDWLLCFLYCCTQIPSYGHFGHIPGETHVGLFKLY
jgi:hypothetical protein